MTCPVELQMGPVLPVDFCGPVAPVGPAGPVTPVVPAAPVGFEGPAGPVGPVGPPPPAPLVCVQVFVALQKHIFWPLPASVLKYCFPTMQDPGKTVPDLVGFVAAAPQHPTSPATLFHH
ncbi:MAG: hypothetical protein ACLQGV_21780 [Bryobacteraceae bacterium]